MSNERPDGWYWVKAHGDLDWMVVWLRNVKLTLSRNRQEWTVGKDVHECTILVDEIGPRIPSPDDPAPATSERPEELLCLQDLRNLQDGFERFLSWPERNLLLTYIAALEAEVRELRAERERQARALKVLQRKADLHKILDTTLSLDHT